MSLNKFPEQKELILALTEAAKEGIGSIILTNIDPEADYKALIRKNHSVLTKYNLIIEQIIDKLEDGSIKITLTLLHTAFHLFYYKKITQDRLEVEG
jgi:hypothetical protein